MKIKLSVVIEIDEKRFPKLSKSEIKSHFQGNFDLFMQQLESETISLLGDINSTKK